MTTLHSTNAYSDLDKRRLWYDGDSSYSISQLSELMIRGKCAGDSFLVHNDGSSMFSSELTLIKNLIPSIMVEEKSGAELDYSLSRFWKMPEKYKRLNLLDFFVNIAAEKIDFTSKSYTSKEALDRIIEELTQFKGTGHMSILRALVYLVDVMRDNEIVWGTGRGSSCCLYILYLLDLHTVDCIEFDLNCNEFFRTNK